jgi:site-specific recombinase XerD
MLEKADTNNLANLALADQWLADLAKRNYAQNTINTYRQAWEKLKHFRDGRDIDKSLIVDWLAHLRDEGMSPATVRLWKSGIASLYQFLKRNYGVLEDPTDIAMPRKKLGKANKRSSLSDNEVMAVLGTCDDSAEGLRDKLVLSLLVYCALRGIEIIRANAEDLRTEGGRSVLYVRGKGSEEADQFVVLPAPVEVALLDWQKVREETEPLIHGLGNKNRGRLTTAWLRSMVKKRFAGAGIKNGGKTTHSLRHTAITKAILNGATPLQAMAMARHKNLEQTMKYFHQVQRTEAPAEDLIQYS